MERFKVRVRIEIVPESEGDAARREPADLDGVEEETVERVAAESAASIDDMEETLLKNGYETMRRALSRHFEKVSKRGLYGGRPRPT